MVINDKSFFLDVHRSFKELDFQFQFKSHLIQIIELVQFKFTIYCNVQS